MKIKLLFLTIASLLLTYLIFTTNIDNRLDIVSLYDTTTTTRPNFNDYLLKYLDNNVSYSINQKYSNKNLEIENVISNINSNKNKIQEKIHDAEIVIIYFGDFELLNEDVTPTELLEETENLFKIIRKINSKQIIFLSPVNIKSSHMYKSLCQKYKISYINTTSYLEKTDISNNLINETGHQKLGKILYSTISSTWNL